MISVYMIYSYTQLPYKYIYINIVFIVVKIFYILHSRWKQGTLRYLANIMQFEI